VEDLLQRRADSGVGRRAVDLLGTLPGGAGRALGNRVVLITLAAVASRVLLLAVGEVWLAAPIPPALRADGYVPSISQLERLSLGDPGWYATIKDSGYEQLAYEDESQHNWAFMPAWPYLWRFVDAVAPARAGAVVLNVLLFAAGVALVYVVLRDHVGEHLATVAVALLIVCPGAQYTMRPGPESLFLFASALTLWAAGRRSWWWAVAPALLVSLTRPQGVLIVVPLVLLFRRDLRDRRGSVPARWYVSRSAALVAPIVGAAGMCLLMWRMTGNPMATLQIQRAWGNDGTVPGLGVARNIKHLLVDGDLTDWYGWTLIPLSLPIVLTGVGLVVYGFRRRVLPWHLWAYAAVSVGVVLLGGQTGPALRYLLVVFPLFALTAALLGPRRRLLPAVAGALLALQVGLYLAALQGATWALN
jgi:hypothetical protein